jgi:hypothetical protein
VMDLCGCGSPQRPASLQMYFFSPCVFVQVYLTCQKHRTLQNVLSWSERALCSLWQQRSMQSPENMHGISQPFSVYMLCKQLYWALSILYSLSPRSTNKHAAQVPIVYAEDSGTASVRHSGPCLDCHSLLNFCTVTFRVCQF